MSFSLKLGDLFSSFSNQYWQADSGIFAVGYPKLIMGFPNRANYFSCQKPEGYGDTK